MGGSEACCCLNAAAEQSNAHPVTALAAGLHKHAWPSVLCRLQAQLAAPTSSCSAAMIMGRENTSVLPAERARGGWEDGQQEHQPTKATVNARRPACEP